MATPKFGCSGFGFKAFVYGGFAAGLLLCSTTSWLSNVGANAVLSGPLSVARVIQDRGQTSMKLPRVAEITTEDIEAQPAQTADFAEPISADVSPDVVFESAEPTSARGDATTDESTRARASPTFAAKPAEEAGSCSEDHYWVGRFNPACSKYYFSFVLCVRNDNYGGSFQHRLRAMLQATVTLLSEYGGKPMASGKVFSAEIVVVEYRPIATERLTKDIIASYISPYLKNKHISIRVITVPGAVIETWPDPKGLIVAEYAGKNIGIRRARGQFVLAANADDILSEAMIHFIAKGLLDYGVYYRAHLADPWYPPGGSEGWSAMPADKFSSKTLEMTSGRNPCKVKPSLCERPARNAAECKKAKTCRVYSEEADYNGNICAVGGLLSAEKVRNHPSRKLFTVPNLQAPGDFILMSRKDWFGIGAHAEVLAHRHHFDGWVECRALFKFGLAQVNLNAPCLILHQDHGGKAFRRNIVSTRGDTAVSAASGTFGMKLNGVPKARYRGIHPAAKQLGIPEVKQSRDLTATWIQSYKEGNTVAHKNGVLSKWDWNIQMASMFGGKKPNSEFIEQVCKKTSHGGPGERLFDGHQYHPDHFGWPEWVFPEVIFEV